ncbi:DUF2867 domain-containing protein [Nocardioides sp. KIGAM211]|uniref:DUF2867 domain-containing protein n=1 Tax=Nocardioides luti TaxID=2761101 RepID=A0A7X0RHF1_9ACTN|nr:DUF2867 domain-containing protein [Nocardioides luti]MBB6628374.1 DUF2867 domain-containing protein [Nocardioides luti]
MRRRTSLHSSGRRSDVDLAADRAWPVVASGQDRPQWYVDAAPFVFRGAVDRLVGGEGRRWRPPGTPVLSTGDTAGFWRVVEADHGARRLVLEADLRSPGSVLLHTEVTPLGETRCRVTQRVSFAPRGLLGTAYLLADLPAREAVIELVHRRLLTDLERR